MRIKYFIGSKLHFIIALLIILISVAMHFNHFNKDLIGMHVWRQTQTQATINSFYKEDFNILHPKKNDRGNGDGIFRMEFPLMQWGVACLYKVFGDHLIISRVCMFIIGLLSVFGMYHLLKSIFLNEQLALIGAWAFNFSPCFYYYTINPLPDNLALCSGIWGLAFFFYWIQNHKTYELLLAGVFLSIATLCKLPFILYYVVPFVYFVQHLVKNKLSLKFFSNFSMLFLWVVFPLSWYLMVIPEWRGNGVVNGVLDNRISLSTFLDYAQHNLISTLPELLINYAALPFFIAGLYFCRLKNVYKHKFFPMFLALSCALLIYFFFEINMIAKVHDYYLFPFYPVLFMLVAYGAYRFMQKGNRIKNVTLFLIVILPITAYARMHKRWDMESPGFNKDLLIYKNDLRSIVPGNELCIAGSDVSHFIFLYYIDKKGWTVAEDLSAVQMKQMISEGARYFYSDNQNVDTREDIIPFLDELVFQKGSFKVYRLK
jgi:hypothetical protein